MNKKLIYLLAALIAIVPIAYLVVMYPHLPASVPTHFGLNGQPDDNSSKQSLFVSIGGLTLISVGLFFLLINIEKIDPKRPKNSPALMSKIGLAVMLILSAVQLMIVDSAKTGFIRFDQFLLPGLGLFFAFLGNLFYSIKPNYFVGMRTPWTLESEDNWRLTHHLAGKLWFGGGLLIMLITALLPFKYAIIFFIAVTIIITLIPLVYSYVIFKKSKTLQ